MSTILDLNEQARKILDELYFLDDEFEDEAERIEVLNVRLNEIYGNAEGKINFVLNLYLEAQAKTAATDVVYRQLQKKKKSCEAAEIRLKNWILSAMSLSGIRKVTGEFANANYLDGMESVVVLDDSFLPEELVKTEIVRTPNKKEILHYVREHGAIEGVAIKKTPYVKIG